jgi:Uri superfamily endonuclease
LRTLNELPVAEKGAYVLQFRLEATQSLAVGRLGTFTFRQGHYFYVGSARGGLRGRLLRHLRGGRRHWHVDYVLDRAVIEAVYVRCSIEAVECRLARVLAETLEVPVRGFGSSDCACVSHLFYAAAEGALGEPRELELEQLHLGSVPVRG